MRILFLSLFLLFSTLHADFIEDYIQQEIIIDRQVNLDDSNMTDMSSRLSTGNKNFILFFLKYVGEEKKQHIDAYDPYHRALFKLNRQIQTNEYLGNDKAVLRDKLKVASIKLKQNMRETLYQTVKAAQDSSYSAFEKKLEQIIIDRYKQIQNLDLRPYNAIKQENDPSALSQSILENLKVYMALQDLNNDLSAALFESSHKIYKIIVLSQYGILSLSIKIEGSTVGKNITQYLEPLYLSSSKVVYILIIMVMIFMIRFITAVAVRKISGWISGKEDDAKYILNTVDKPFTLLLITIGTELIFIIYSELSDVQWVFTTFKIMYILLSVFLLYRLGNAIAIVKIEQINLNKHVRNEVVNLSLKLMNILLVLITLVWVLKIMGVNLTALLSGLGLGGVAVAFAAKDTIANFFGSVSILLGDLFEQGDWIAVDNMEGHVVEIGLRATTIRTFDNALIAIPNFKLADNGIKNWSRRLMGRRIKMIIGVTYESDMDDIKRALSQIRTMIQEHPDLMSEKTQFMSNDRLLKLVSKEDLKGIKRTVMVNLDNFSSSSIDIMIYCFSRSVVWAEWYEVKEDVMFKVAQILKENNLEFAYPTMMIHQAQLENKSVPEDDGL